MVEELEAGLSLGDAFNRVGHLLAVGQRQRAQELAASLIARDPASGGAHRVMAIVLMAVGDREGALGAAGEAIRLDPENDASHLVLARVLFLQGRFAEGEAASLTALAIEPTEAGSHLLYARLLTACERYAAAARVVENALGLDPDDAEAHALRAQILLHLKPSEWSVSEEAAIRALKLDPDNADAHAILGAVHLRAGRGRAAEERFRDALRLHPSSALALRGLAETVMGQSPLYAPFLRYSLFMERVGIGVQVAVVAGLWAIVSALGSLMSVTPGFAPYFPWVRYGYLAFCAYTWFAAPITRWILGQHYPWLAAAARE